MSSFFAHGKRTAFKMMQKAHQFQHFALLGCDLNEECISMSVNIASTDFVATCIVKQTASH